MPRGGRREPPGGRPPKEAGVKVVKRRICVKCKAYVGEKEHVCGGQKRQKPEPFRLPSMPPDIDGGM